MMPCSCHSGWMFSDKCLTAVAHNDRSTICSVIFLEHRLFGFSPTISADRNYWIVFFWRGHGGNSCSRRALNFCTITRCCKTVIPHKPHHISVLRHLCTYCKARIS